MSNKKNVKQTPRADARIAMRIPSITLDLISRAANQSGRSTSAMALRLMQRGLANMITEGSLAV